MSYGHTFKNQGIYFGSLWKYPMSDRLYAGVASGMSELNIKGLRQETENLFYHGFTNYMEHAFPEDELRPLTCKPLTRDQNNPAHIELNDPLGNYSLTLIDSLSTLAILASGSGSKAKSERALAHFQNGVAALVEQYGDGTTSIRGQGKKARGFDVDSKVQVFETVIRGVGGLLSAHLFAVGELPIAGYDPRESVTMDSAGKKKIRWSKDFLYDGQLLRLAQNLGERLLPAFSTVTGLPYPRVNLRHGVPFYRNSPLSCESEHGQCLATPPSNRELTETCSAGAGSLVLEFTVLSRLTGDPRFEYLAKRAFWSVWERRSNIGLIGSVIDAESGLWTSSFTGLGAGIDSFFEYAVKSHILLSGSPAPLDYLGEGEYEMEGFDLAPPLSAEHHDPGSFLQVWQDAHAAIKRHLYRGEMYMHPHYIQADLNTGAARAYWMDSLSAFFPGLLATTGDLDEATEIHLLFTALWTRYSALPERWSAVTGSIEGGLGWWGGRPEFIESTYHLYRATKDPWYLHVGEMVLRDIKRRCWTKCGWSGMQDVRTGERNDRMESFFLGETAKYLHLLFDPDHPLNKLDAPFVFTTEGHPLLIPRSARPSRQSNHDTIVSEQDSSTTTCGTCPVPGPPVPFSMSVTATRSDIFHAANLARLHLMPTINNLDSPIIEYSRDHPSITLSDIRSPSNYTYFPWTLPLELVPHNGTCSVITQRPTYDITFPSLPNMVLTPGMLQRVGNGILINAVGGLRLGMIQDVPVSYSESGGSGDEDSYRIQAINNIPLGKDEKIFIARDIVSSVVNPQDPNFTRVRDPAMLDIVIDVAGTVVPPQFDTGPMDEPIRPKIDAAPEVVIAGLPGVSSDAASHIKMALSFLANHVTSAMQEQPATPDPKVLREYLPAITPTGIGAAPVPDVQEALGPDIAGAPQGSLMWDTIYVADDNCKSRLPVSVPREHQIIVLRRGGCSFIEKLENIPSFAPSWSSLKLVIVVSFEEADSGGPTDGIQIRPLLDSVQVTSSGLPRHNPVPLVMVGGGQKVYNVLRRAVGVGIKRRYSVHAQGVPISNLIII
ncbi:alpha mannosidase-like protein [Lambiella insularis]|nr:alpha mannosidase-like protein [Lambiella insularis]